MNNLSKNAFLVNEISIKTDLAKLAPNDRRRFVTIRQGFYATQRISEFDLSELRRLRALSNRRDTRWLYQDVNARFNTVFNPVKSR
jgi:hypothetical protein